MKKRQENRDYRRIKDEAGNVIANIITVNAVDVEVTEEVFLTYSQSDRRERYIADEVEPGKILSLDKLVEDAVPLEKLGVQPTDSAEYITLENEAREISEIYEFYLPDALFSLREADQELIQALFFDGMSTREYARQTGVTQHAVIKRRDRILKDLRNFLKNSYFEGIREGE